MLGAAGRLFVSCFLPCATTGMLAMLLSDLSRAIGSKTDSIAVLQLCRRLSGFIASTNAGFSRLRDVDKLTELLQRCSNVRSLKKLHARVVTLGLGWDCNLGSPILDCYANLDVLPNPRLGFQGILNDDLARWNSAMVDNFRAGHPQEVILLYKDLKLRQIHLDGKSVTFGLKGCIELQNLLLGKGMHADSLKLCLGRDKFVGSALVGLYSKLGRMDDSQKAFEEILDKDIVAYTSMITGYSENVDPISWNAFDIASDMLQNNLEVNRVTLVSLLQVAGNLGAIREGKSVHCYSIRRGIGVLDEVLETSLVDMYTRCEAYQLATAVLRSSKGTVASWNAMIAGLSRSEQSGDAIQCFSVMLHEHKIIPDSITYTNVISACAELCNAGYAASVHAYLIRRSIPLDLVLVTALIEQHGEKLDSVTLMTAVQALCELGHLKGVKQVHGLVYRALLEEDMKTRNSLITAYAKCGRTHGNTILGEIISKELLELDQQNPGTYALISEVFAQKGQWNESANARNRTKENGLRKLPGSSLIESVEQSANYQTVVPEHREQRSLFSKLAPPSILE
ncbi:hypothetical protein PR202_gb25935 [Eleusine coracana subsp. coracana]|uniref:Pentatricopeptide repeat-containing protein n=1 Tax=Eleusine coracana subsp. coracana TaxID=191504 RepID=A0AAV5FQU8_ELECO|nr:hypothetical protein PR202_gb25935 [Eleusine coracana subsp. coracana]